MTDSANGLVYFLMVDDRKENLVALEALLRRDGLVLLWANSGPEALEFLLTYEVSLALVDVQMPGMDGFELAELMRGAERTRRVPIIFLTAGATDQKRRFRGYDAGAVDFLGRPLEPDVLRSKVGVFYELACQREELKAALAANAELLKESQRQAAALQETDRLKNVFLAMLAHELRNPLAAVSNAVQILKRNPPAPQQELAKSIIDNQMRTFTRLIEDLLDVSRVNHGKIQVKKQVVDPGPMLENAVAAVETLLRERRHTLEIRLDHGDGRVNVDPTRLEQIVVNLLTNAAKYSENEARIRLASHVEGEELVIRVRDEGIGIPPEQLPRMFELFAQGDRSIDRSEGGLGIGLTLVRSLVEMHEGSIQAESQGLGHGSTFTVRLPLVEVEATSPLGSNGEPDGGDDSSRMDVLIVDDSQDAAWGLSELLKIHGYQTRVAHDGPAALAETRERRPDVVLLDIGLPGMTGYEVAQAIRADELGRNILLIAVTGYGQKQDRDRTREAGFDHHLTKPVEFEQLLGLLDAATAAKQASAR